MEFSKRTKISLIQFLSIFRVWSGHQHIEPPKTQRFLFEKHGVSKISHTDDIEKFIKSK